MRNACVVVLFSISASAIAEDASDSMIDAQGYVAKVQLRAGEPIEPLPEFASPKPYHYSSKDLRDPFVLPLFTQAGVKGQPDMGRSKEQLEAFTLDSLQMVGTLSKHNQVWALVMAPTEVIHKVTIGSYLGKDFGKIVKISRDKIEIIETVPDGVGGWKKREASLSLVN